MMHSTSSSAACDGSDSHALGWPTRNWLKLSAGALAALAVEILLHLPSQIMILMGAYALAGLIGPCIRTRIDGPYLIVQRFGGRRKTLLSAVTQVERYAVQGRTSLRLRQPNNKRGVYVRVDGIGGGLSQAAAGHLLHYLDQPDVTWGPGAWNLLCAKAGNQAAVAQGGSTAPQGTSRPRSRRERIYGRLALGGALVGAVTLLVVTPIAWSSYLSSRAIQDGPEVDATLQSGWVQDDSGGRHTTFFAVSFPASGGRLIDTTFSAPGIWSPLNPGASMPIRYDPGDPQHAAIPGEQSGSLSEAITLTVTTGSLLASLLFVGYTRRRRRG